MQEQNDMDTIEYLELKRVNAPYEEEIRQAIEGVLSSGWYLRGMPHAASWRNRAMRCVAVDDYLAMVDELVAAGAQT